MRFIFNFFFFGLLFYLIYLFFPDAFHTLLGWVNQLYEGLKDMFSRMSSKVEQTTNRNPHPEHAILLWLYVKNQLMK